MSMGDLTIFMGQFSSKYVCFECFRRAAELQKHYIRSHFPCKDPDCVTMGIVFRTEVELEIHMVSAFPTIDSFTQS